MHYILLKSNNFQVYYGCQVIIELSPQETDNSLNVLIIILHKYYSDIGVLVYRKQYA